VAAAQNAGSAAAAGGRGAGPCLPQRLRLGLFHLLVSVLLSCNRTLTHAGGQLIALQLQITFSCACPSERYLSGFGGQRLHFGLLNMKNGPNRCTACVCHAFRPICSVGPSTITCAALRCRSRAQAIPLPNASVSAAVSLEAQAVEAIVPGLDFCNHSASPTCRWQVSSDSRVRRSVMVAGSLDMQVLGSAA